MESRGHVVRVVEVDFPALFPGGRVPLIDRIPRWSFRQRYYFWRQIPLQDYRYHNALRRVVRPALRAFRPDSVHCLHPYYWGAVAEGRRPHVVTAYGLEVEDAPPIRAIMARAARIHCISNFTRQLAERAGAPPERCRVISWGIQAIDARPRSKSFDLATVGRLVKRKNVDTVLRAMALLPELSYVVVGDGPELTSLRSLAYELGVEGRVTFAGHVSDRERERLLSESRLFVMCPREEPGDVEGLGLVYYEAHAAGLPCVGALSGGVPDAIGDGGVLIHSAEDVAGLARAVTRALEPGRYEQLCAAVIRRQHACSWGRFLDQFEQLYEESRDAWDAAGAHLPSISP